MKEQFILLKEIIKSKCGQGTVYYFPNHGNWGDAIIRYGTRKFFRDIGLHFREIHTLEDFRLRASSISKILSWIRKNDFIIYGGGGAWCQVWDCPVYHHTQVAS